VQTADIEVLRELYRNDKVDLYRFHQLYSLPPGQLAKTINRLMELRVLELVDDSVQLTDFGRRWVVANRRLIFLRDRAQEWKDIPENMRQDRMPINSLYKPKKSLIDRQFFGNLMEDKGVDNMH
jgi:hypothetical protein